MPLITFEGIDGCGKSTQAAKFQEYIESKGCEAPIFREPGATKTGELIRSILLHPELQMHDITELLLFYAARSELCENILKPRQNKGLYTILDRFYDSSFAYQGYARGLDLKILDYLTNLVTLGVKPDLTFILDIDIITARTRRMGAQGKKNLDRLEKEAEEFYQKVKSGYLEIARNEPERCVVINAEKGIGEIFEQVLEIFNSRFSI